MTCCAGEPPPFRTAPPAASTSYLPGLSASSTEPESVIYMVTVTYHSSADDAGV